MKALAMTRISLTWFLLVGATLLSFELGHGAGIPDGRWASVAILVITFAKVRFVVRDFMEIRHAPGWLRWLFDAWIFLACSLLIGLLLLRAP